jgi:hypothetical protein
MRNPKLLLSTILFFSAPAFAETVLYVLPNNLGYIREERLNGKVTSSSVNMGSISFGGNVSIGSGIIMGDGNTVTQTVTKDGDVTTVTSGSGLVINGDQIILNGKRIQKEKLKHTVLNKQDEQKLRLAKSQKAACAEKLSLAFAKAMGKGDEDAELDLEPCDEAMEEAREQVTQAALKRASVGPVAPATLKTTPSVASSTECTPDVLAASKAVANFHSKGYAAGLIKKKNFWAWSDVTPKEASTAEVKATEDTIRKAFKIGNPALVRQILLARPLDFATQTIWWPQQEAAWLWYSHFYNKNRTAAGYPASSDDKIKAEIARVVAAAKPCWNILTPPSTNPKLIDFSKPKEKKSPQHK